MAAAAKSKKKEESETKEASSRLDSHKEIVYPLDYSFKAVSVFSGKREPWIFRYHQCF